MNKLCFLAISLVVYGSLWPFNFAGPEGEPFREFLNTIDRRYGPRDLITNVGLFLPIGLFGVLGARGSKGVPKRVIFVTIGGVVLATALQIAQIYVPARLPDLQDVLWNCVGLGLGVNMGWLCWRLAARPFWHRLEMPLIPAMLLSAWAIFRLVPFTPWLSAGSLRANLTAWEWPLAFNADVLLQDVMGWLVVAYLVAAFLSASPWLVPVIMAGSFIIEIAVIHNIVTPSEILSALIAWIIWQSWPATRLSAEKGLLTLVLFLLLIDATWPLTLTNGRLVFLQGASTDPSALNHMSEIVIWANGFFLYGSALYLFWRLGSPKLDRKPAAKP